MADYRRASTAELRASEDVRLPSRGPAAYFVNYVKDQLVEKYGAGRVFSSGLKVTTTIDLELQKSARKAIETILRNPTAPLHLLRRSRRRPGLYARCSAAATSARASSTSLRRRSASRARRSSRSFSPPRCARASHLDRARVEADLHRCRRPGVEV